MRLESRFIPKIAHFRVIGLFLRVLSFRAWRAFILFEFGRFEHSGVFTLWPATPALPFAGGAFLFKLGVFRKFVFFILFALFIALYLVLKAAAQLQPPLEAYQVFAVASATLVLFLAALFKDPVDQHFLLRYFILPFFMPGFLIRMGLHYGAFERWASTTFAMILQRLLPLLGAPQPHALIL